MDLIPCVLSSSSGRQLSNLIEEVGSVSNVVDFDLLIPRTCELFDPEPEARLSHFVANQPRFNEYAKELVSQLNVNVNVAALATYFPNISAVNDNQREEAINALVNVFALTKQLKPWMKEPDIPVVEVVCGKTVELMPNGKVGIFGTKRKVDLLVKSLSRVVHRVKTEVGLQAFAIALEMEPGEIYLFKNMERLQEIMDRCAGELANHIGINVDIAHFRIAGISANELRQYLDRIVHSHISDHPRIHTHDQVVGSWTNVEQRRGGYIPYLKLLMDRFDTPSALPFSGRIAIELEGCNRIFALHDSVTRLRHAIAIARHLPSAQRH